MKRWLTFVSVLAMAVALGGVVSRIPRALSEVEAFRVTEIRLRGERFFTLEEAVRTLDLPEDASVWDDTKSLEAKVLEHPLVKDVKIHRRFPNALLLQVVEEEPVALFPHPVLEPVDEGGHLLPIDPVFHQLDLPIMTAEGGEGPASLTSDALKALAGEIHRLAEGEPELHARISDFSMSPRGDVSARLTDSPVTLHFRPGLSSGRIQVGFQVLRNAEAQFTEKTVVDLDLRFDGQVVVRLGRAQGS